MLSKDEPINGYCLPFVIVPPSLQTSTFKYSPSSYYILAITFLWQLVVSYSRGYHDWMNYTQPLINMNYI
jgi:hypothetical protein